MSRTEVHIDRLALTGLSPADARTAAATLEAHLTALLSGRPQPASWGSAAECGRAAALAVHTAVVKATAGDGRIPTGTAR